MNVRTILSVAAITSALAFPGLAVAQDSHMIGGKAVPADQVEAVETRCQELRSLATETPAAETPAAEAPAAGDAAKEVDASTEVWSGDIFSIANLTVDHCDEGKFAMPVQ